MKCSLQTEFGGRSLSFETGRMARQANGAVVVTYGDTVVLVTACRASEPREEVSFLPLTVEYRERFYSAGKIPGGFFKREGRPGDRETLTARIIDRPIRPLFPNAWRYETQVIAFVVSADGLNEPDILALNGASAALTISDLPFDGPIGAVRIGRVAGDFVVNPSRAQLDDSDMDIIIAGSREAIVMVEGSAKEISEEDFLQAVDVARGEIDKSIELQLELAKLAGHKKLTIQTAETDLTLCNELDARFRATILQASLTPEKMARSTALREIRCQAIEAFVPEDTEDRGARLKEVKAAFKSLEKDCLRQYILRESKRSDGRGLSEIRPITTEVGVLPRVHGSALFTRGETQALASVTLGSSRDEQMLDNIAGESSQHFLLHYNFPPFSVGEVRFLRGPGRREIGHGTLAERAVRPVLPEKENFPYTIRVVSDILESNGSSSMATVCGASMSLMDAGVPIREPVAGIAMGLIAGDDGTTAVLSDILGLEDHLGDMDFKVAGSRRGITAIQMDIKMSGVSRDLLHKALEQAREGRMFILDEMDRTISQFREELSKHAPRILSIKISPDRIKDVIGPGGKVIKGIIAETGVDIDIEDTGIVNIVSNDAVAADRAREIIEQLTEELEIGTVYMGEVKRIESYGAFVEIRPGVEGLVHVTELADHYIKNVSDEISYGEKFEVKLIDIDRQGRLKLSRKAVAGSESPEEGVAQDDDGWERGGARSRDDDRGRDRDYPRGRGRDGGDRGRERHGDRDRDRARSRGDRSRSRPSRDYQDRDDRDRNRSRERSRDRDRSRPEPARDRDRERPRDRDGEPSDRDVRTRRRRRRRGPREDSSGNGSRSERSRGERR